MKKKMKQPTKMSRKTFLSLKRKGVISLGIVAIFTLGFVLVNAANNRKSDLVTNDFTVSHLEGKLDETFEPGTETAVNKEIKKEVKVANTGNTNLFVRIMVLPEMVSKDGIQLPANIKKTTDTGTTAGQIELLNYNATEWIDGGDDYYYYTKKIAPEKSSTSLFTGIKLDESVLTGQAKPSNPNEFYYEVYDGGSLKIAIKAETITTDGDNYQTAWNMKDETGAFKSTSLENVAKALDKEKE
ncbi:hypothetical protein P7H60_02610 [Vagococcus carniphilus]|uniref:Alternate signal-mediated exported protein, CPF_0494 family n=1 Tax=Vagococcus carniphilus TaxID=218144 RepID=A0AAW8U2H2_9ENTE|nr:hypothetical protein [Vagococcus carniphilus]MDT2830484.1 hypothetical protein [Vagococcus carniphilus]MDT2832519.1 hypothetical protein [Vagococcus carniphilus]MDT2839782.1 hypothetical protein [Vagococcus carniphilus]MDT2848060.1 hypothetical protein [Vagococcus carniphilus]MDT2854771.1 hypothetical protein [Vagococcus carniphilus]